MNKNDHIIVTITDLGSEGEGIGKVDGYTFFVKDAVIGDEVEAIVTKLKSGYGYAKTIKIIKPSEKRVLPQCPIADKCGGCQIMQLKYEEQLKFKEKKVKNNLERIGGQNSFSFNSIIGMEDPFHFRNKVQFPVGYNRMGQVVTGFYAGRTHYIIENGECPVSDQAADKILFAIRQFIEKNNISIYDEKSGTGLIRHVLIRTARATGQIMICLIINGEDIPYKKELITDLLRSADGVSSICLNINKEKTNVILGRKVICLYGKNYIEDKIGNYTFRISPLSFFQVNSVQTEKLYEVALNYAGLTGNETVWDLYCGIGTISLFLSQKAKKVYGVEIVPEAIENAKENANINSIENSEFFCGASEKIFPAMARENVDVVVVDPPRKGCDKELLYAMMAVAPKRIVYVSCDSATLARDVKILSEKYNLVEVTPVDMFPHTVHVETVVLLRREK